MRRCYLHIGTPKTGSTAIQQFLHEHASSLLRFGVLVPTVEAGPKGGHYPLVRAVIGMPIPLRFATAPRDFAELVASHPEADVIVSDERLTTYLRSRSRANSLLSFFGQCGLEVVLLGYFRNQPQRLNSGYSQGVKAIQIDVSFEDRIAVIHSSGVLDYTICMEVAARSGCQLLAKPFNALVRSAGVVQDFLNTVGVDPQRIKLGPEKRINRSLGPCAVAAVQEVMRRATALQHQWTQQQRFAARMLITRITEEPQFAEQPYCGFDTKEARAVQAYYQPSNDRFAEAAWGADWATIFKEDVEAEFERNVFEPATASPEEKELYGAILDRFWSGVQSIINDPRLRQERELAVADPSG